MERRGQIPLGVFYHGEKVAGTSFRYSAEHALGKSHVAIYSPEADRLARSSDNLMPATTPRLDRLRQAFGNPVLGPGLVTFWPAITGIYRERIRRRYPVLEIPEDVNFIMGHFTADKFDQMIGDRQQITGFLVRDPFDRSTSHFLHWFRNRGYEDWRVHIPFRRRSKGESLEDAFKRFAMLPQLQNYQTQILAGKDISSIDVVGVTDFAGEFTEAFLLRLAEAGIPLQRSEFEQRRLNVTPERRRLRINREKLGEDFLQEFRERHSEDYALYEQARAIQQRSMAQGNTGK